jgi:cytochrome P450
VDRYLQGAVCWPPGRTRLRVYYVPPAAEIRPLDIEVDGQLIRAGESVVVSGDMANRDPEVFPDPDRLDIHRDASRHVAFGWGAHQCLGQSLVRVTLQAAYGTLYRRIPSLSLAVPISQVRFKHDNLVYGVYELPVTW